MNTNTYAYDYTRVLSVCLLQCVCACVRARARACVCVCVCVVCCVCVRALALSLTEVLERLGGTKEILTGLIHVLTVGTEWAAQNAARAIGNIAYRSENLPNFVSLDETARDKLIYGLAKLAKHDMRSKSKEYAAMGIANLVVHDVLLASFGKVPGLMDDLALLQNNSEPAISAEATRAVTIINQARFGTVSWRAPKRI
jgi:hypothetical protein